MIDFSSEETVFSKEDVDELIHAFEQFGGVAVTPGTGKILIQGQEMDIRDVLMNGFEGRNHDSD